MRQVVSGVALLAMLSACGGSSELGGGTAANNGGNGPRQLPPCQLGFDPTKEPNRSCNWLAGTLCYDTLDGACACACPVDHPAQCVSGSPVTGGKIKVACI